MNCLHLCFGIIITDNNALQVIYVQLEKMVMEKRFEWIIEGTIYISKYKVFWYISEEREYVTDVGSYDIEIRYGNGRRKEISGSLIGTTFSHVYGHEDNVDVTRLIRRYIPVYGLWAFDGSTSPDYEGKKQFIFFQSHGRNIFTILI